MNVPVPLIAEPVETFEWGGGQRPTTELLATLDDISNEDLLDVTPLYDVIDPDAIDAMFSPGLQQEGEASIYVRFEYLNYIIILQDTGLGEIFEKSEIN